MYKEAFNNVFKEVLEKKGLLMTGVNEKNDLIEIIELTDHPWFVGVQFHPEFKSKPIKAHPIFKDFIGASYKTKQ